VDTGYRAPFKSSNQYSVGRFVSQGAILALQRKAGNAALTALLQQQLTLRGQTKSSVSPLGHGTTHQESTQLAQRCGEQGCPSDGCEPNVRCRPAAAGRNLLAHGLEHVIQQRMGEPLGIQRQMVYASGFDSPYARDADEIASFTSGTWAPSSVDFATTTGLARGGTGAATLDALSSEIKAAERHSISQLGLIGHAVNGAFVLSGTISVETDGVRFGKEGVISTASLLGMDYLNWRDRFAPSATITLYGCNSGMDQELLDTFSQAAGVCVFGFKGAIKWCVTSDGAGAIASRGRTRLDSASPTADTGCQTYTADIGTLTPDAQSCAGAPGGGSNSPTGG
jgi:hypothetical protein